MAPGKHTTVIVCWGLKNGGVGMVEDAGGIVDDDDGTATKRRCFLPRPLLDDDGILDLSAIYKNIKIIINFVNNVIKHLNNDHTYRSNEML